jgi:rRNA maturation RNase YbeY
MEPPSPYSIPISNESGFRVRTSLLRKAIRATLGRHHAPSGRLAVLLTTNEEIRRLNRGFRELDESTDVLTFSAPPNQARSSRIPFMLGDVAISVEYAQSQAALRGVDLDDEVAYLGIHGALHICGFDDVEPDDRRKMQIAMADMGDRVGLTPDPSWVSLLHAAVQMEASV